MAIDADVHGICVRVIVKVYSVCGNVPTADRAGRRRGGEIHVGQAARISHHHYIGRCKISRNIARKKGAGQERMG